MLRKFLAGSQCRFEEDRALCIIVKRVHQLAGCSTDIAAFCIHGADMDQAVAPGLLRGVDHLFADDHVEYLLFVHWLLNYLKS